MPAAKILPWDKLELVRISQIASYLSIGIESARQLTIRGHLKKFAIAGQGSRSQIRVKREDVDTYIDSCEIQIFPRARKQKAKPA